MPYVKNETHLDGRAGANKVPRKDDCYFCEHRGECSDDCPNCHCNDCLNGYYWKNDLVQDKAPVSGGSTPHQYALPPGATELQDLIEYRAMNFAIGNIFKACYRMGLCDHSDTMRDLQKIKWFVEREINRVAAISSKENQQCLRM